MTIQTLPGFREFYPEACGIRNAIFANWRETAAAFRFDEYDVPVLEPLELFTQKSGEEIVDQLFAFKDKGGREVALRPEITPSLIRIVTAKYNALPKPIKWFSIGENFRYERPQKGRLRSFYQFNADIIGEASVNADAEIIALAINIFRKFGLTSQDFHIRLSDRKLWTLFFQSQAVDDELIPSLLAVIDKIERDPREVIEQRVQALRLQRQAGNLLEQIDIFKSLTSIEAIQAFFASKSLSENIQSSLASCLQAWHALLKQLEAMELMPFVSIDLQIVRGLNYYTGFVFEVFERSGQMRALAGGGRYDNLAQKLGGMSLPAVGFAAGDVTLQNLLTDLKKLPASQPQIDFFFVIDPTHNDARLIALRDAQNLRLQGYTVDYSIHPTTSWNKQTKLASERNVLFALFYDAETVQNQTVKLKNLKTNHAEEIPLESLIASIAKIHPKFANAI